MMFCSVVSEEILSKDLQSRCPEQRNIGERGEKKDSEKSTNSIKIPKNSESLKKIATKYNNNKDSEGFGIFKKR